MIGLRINRGFLAGICSAAVLLLPSESGAVSARSQDLMQQGYAECKSAHLLRRKDLQQAKSAYENYLNLKAQAVAIDAKVLVAKNAEIERIVSYCETVGADMARSEALPVFTQGAAACGEAAEYLRNNQLEQARQSYSRYLQQKDEAVAISDAILEVFSVRTEVRRCERVWQDIEVADARAGEIKVQLQESGAYLQETLKICQALVEPDTDQSDPDEMAVAQLKESLQEVQSHREQMPNPELLENSDTAVDENQLAVLTDLHQEIEGCRESVQARIDEAEQQLIALAEEEARKQAELEAQQAEQQQVAEVQPETEEQRMARLSNNYGFYKLVKRVSPQFPRRALRGGTEGYVVVEYMINPEGKVFDAVIVDSEPKEVFDKAAITAIKQWQYKADFAEQEPDVAVARTRMHFSLSD